MANILLINGPNLHLLGEREPLLYGTDSLATIVDRLTTRAQQAGHQLLAFQSNHEGALIDRLQAARQENIHRLLLNAGAYGHTSIALRDALLAFNRPFIEIHITNVYAREAFRQQSYVADLAEARLIGFGTRGYDMALDFALTQKE